MILSSGVSRMTLNDVGRGQVEDISTEAKMACRKNDLSINQSNWSQFNDRYLVCYAEMLE